MSVTLISIHWTISLVFVPHFCSCFLLGHNMVKDITVVDTNYTDYALVLKHKVFNREYTQVALYGETQIHIYHYFYITSKHVS